jgi:hypothetical protein
MRREASVGRAANARRDAHQSTKPSVVCYVISIRWPPQCQRPKGRLQGCRRDGPHRTLPRAAESKRGRRRCPDKQTGDDTRRQPRAAGGWPCRFLNDNAHTRLVAVAPAATPRTRGRRMHCASEETRVRIYNSARQHAAVQESDCVRRTECVELGLDGQPSLMRPRRWRRTRAPSPRTPQRSARPRSACGRRSPARRARA